MTKTKSQRLLTGRDVEALTSWQPWTWICPNPSTL